MEYSLNIPQHGHWMFHLRLWIKVGNPYKIQAVKTVRRWLPLTMGMCQNWGLSWYAPKNVQTCVVWVGMFIHVCRIYQHSPVIQLKSSSKLACNANRPWHYEAGPTRNRPGWSGEGSYLGPIISFPTLIQYQQNQKTLWLRYLTSHHLRSQTFEISVLLIATAGALRKISSTASAIVRSDSKRGFPGGSPVSYYTNNVFLKKTYDMIYGYMIYYV